MNGICEYCKSVGPARIRAGEGGASQDVFVCDQHWKILKDPKTALPFIRGVLTLKIRGSAPPSYLDRLINKYMEMLTKLTAAQKPKN